MIRSPPICQPLKAFFLTPTVSAPGGQCNCLLVYMPPQKDNNNHKKNLPPSVPNKPESLVTHSLVTVLQRARPNHPFFLCSQSIEWPLCDRCLGTVELGDRIVMVRCGGTGISRDDYIYLFFQNKLSPSNLRVHILDKFKSHFFPHFRWECQSPLLSFLMASGMCEVICLSEFSCSYF
jgi:hypothetical protein